MRSRGDEIRVGGLETGLLSKNFLLIAERQRETGRYRRIYSDDDSEFALVDTVVSSLTCSYISSCEIWRMGDSNPGLQTQKLISCQMPKRAATVRKKSCYRFCSVIVFCDFRVWGEPPPFYCKTVCGDRGRDRQKPHRGIEPRRDCLTLFLLLFQVLALPGLLRP